MMMIRWIIKAEMDFLQLLKVNALPRPLLYVGFLSFTAASPSYNFLFLPACSLIDFQTTSPSCATFALQRHVPMCVPSIPTMSSTSIFFFLLYFMWTLIGLTNLDKLSQFNERKILDCLTVTIYLNLSTQICLTYILCKHLWKYFMLTSYILCNIREL